MLTLSSFRDQCPEFKGATDAKVQAALDQAAARTSAVVFGALVDEAHKWLTAHILASSPQGHPAALHKDRPGETIYGEERRKLENLVGAGWGVLPDA